MSVAAPASRNAPCPCGSGRRYKDCHGSLAGAVPAPQPGVAADDAAAHARRALLHDALARQQAGDFAGAMTGYEAVLAQTPDDFDALHMLGVACYQQHDFERAEGYLRAAIARNPQVAAAGRNLQLLLDARRLEGEQDALCRVVLPRLAHLCVPPDAFAALVRDARTLDLLADVRTMHVAVAVRILRDLALGPVRVHAPVDNPVVGGTAAVPVATLDAPVAVLVGIDTPLAAFGTLDARAARVLVVDRDGPAALHDRVRELSDEGRTRVHVRYVAQALAQALGLPGGVLAAGAGG